jgi:chloramphenicol 3-O-phosphotransferase
MAFAREHPQTVRVRACACACVWEGRRGREFGVEDVRVTNRYWYVDCASLFIAVTIALTGLCGSWLEIIHARQRR